LFTSNGSFTVPSGITTIRVLCVGGGGGGTNGHSGAGGSGYLNTGTFAVTPGESFAVTVGRGGSAGATNSGNDIIWISAGSLSSFGSFLNCSVGGYTSCVSCAAGAGGSGGGGACIGNPFVGPDGGTNGANGNSCDFASGGAGQGSFTPHFTTVKHAVFSAGNGGAGGTE